MPIPKTATKKKKQMMFSDQLRPVSCDITNMRKFAEDYLQGIVILNDKMVVDGRTTEYYSSDPKTVIQVYSIEEYEKRYGQLNVLEDLV
jgi:Holliday junction resolvase RusA-like endonuclease